MNKSGTTTVFVLSIGVWLTAGIARAAAPPDVSEISQGAASALSVSGAEAETASRSNGDADEDDGSVAGGGGFCNPFNLCGDPDCSPQCNSLCVGGNPCNNGCPNRCDPIICSGNRLCDPTCPGGSPCNLTCNPGPCGQGCGTFCDAVLCPQNYCNTNCGRQTCDPACGGNTCDQGCSGECTPNCGGLCNPACLGGHPCNIGCPNVCNVNVCPDNARCNPVLCSSGNTCNQGCSGECTPNCGGLCNPACLGGHPCNIGCPNVCNVNVCPDNARCNPLCPGGDACAPGCTTECTAVCPINLLCNPACEGSPCNVGCNPGPCGNGCGDRCNPILCPANALCDPVCGGSSCNVTCNPGPCGPGCGDECSPVICLANYCDAQRCGGMPQCDLLCGGNPCGPGCPNECNSIICRDNHCNPQRCPDEARCDGTCSGGNYCNPGCSTECSALCPENIFCNPACARNPTQCRLGLPMAHGGARAASPERTTTKAAQLDPMMGRQSLSAEAEPEAGGVDGRIWGFADLHNHQFSHLGFGGRLLAGQPFEPTMSPQEGIGFALHCCGDNRLGTCLSSPLDEHGPCGCVDPIGTANDEIFCHHVSGYPDFIGWPRWYTHSHQQVYFEWLHRAWQGGLRLMSMLAVNNEILCHIHGGIYSCEDMPAVDRQIQGAKDLEAYIDFWDDGELNNSGWYRIAYSAGQARQIMTDGKLAVVLGIEVCRLFGCGQTNAEDCTDEHIEKELQRYFDLGIRQITPIHIIDNAFGGAALYDEFFNAANVLINGTIFGVRDCSAAPEGYDFRMENSAQLLGLLDLIPWFESPKYPEGAHCNAKSLTKAGQTLLRKMMDRGMIIDVDHMSALTMDGALKEAQERRCYPVISSHSGCTAITSGQLNSERLLSQPLLDRVHDLGGLIALGTAGGDACETPGDHEGCIYQYGSVTNNCNNSSRTFAQSYSFLVDHGAESVPFGTDLNGFAGQASPRYGLEACDRTGPVSDQDPRYQDPMDAVQYPFELHGLPGSLGPDVTGERTFNINCDGLAHVGMLPDFVEDLRKIGVDDGHLEPLFRSAEAYVSLWERAERQSDRRTDFRDIKALPSCLEGPTQAQVECACRYLDGNDDGDVDLRDAADLLRSFDGP